MACGSDLTTNDQETLMKSRFALAFAAIAFAFPAAAGGLDDLAWMAGSWMERKDGTDTEEHWLPAKGGMLIAVNRTVNPGEPSTFEFLRIVLADGKPAYLTSPGGRPAEEFKSVEQSATRIVFENPAIEFPRRILYWRDGDALMARIEGTIKGETRWRQWRFERIK
jgi:uncharacterized protein DUF6265